MNKNKILIFSAVSLILAALFFLRSQKKSNSSENSVITAEETNRKSSAKTQDAKKTSGSKSDPPLASDLSAENSKNSKLNKNKAEAKSKTLAELQRRFNYDETDRLALEMLSEILDLKYSKEGKHKLSSTCGSPQTCPVPIEQIIARVKERAPIKELPVAHMLIVDALKFIDVDPRERFRLLEEELTLVASDTSSHADEANKSISLSPTSIVYLNIFRSILALNPTTNQAIEILKRSFELSHDRGTNMAAVQILAQKYPNETSRIKAEF